MRRPLVALAATAVACGSSVSLDDPEAGSDSSGAIDPSSTGSNATFDDSGHDDTDDDWGDDDGAKLDIASPGDVPPDPLPPGVCPPDCQFELSLGWAYDGPAGPPLLPEDRVAITQNEEGRIIVAEQRGGAITLARVGFAGDEEWTLPLALPCTTCRLVDLDLHPLGELLLSGYGEDQAGTPVAFVAQVELRRPFLRWAQAVPLFAGTGVVPRAGGLALDGFDRLVQPVVHASPVDGQERLELFVYSAATGELTYVDGIATGDATGDTAPPLAVSTGDGVIASSQPVWSNGDLAGELAWFELLGGIELAREPRPHPALALARSEVRTLSLGQDPAEGETTLVLHSGTATTPTQWIATHVQPTDSAPVPALATAGGHAYVATRIATGAPGRERDRSVQLLRWSEDGTPVWKVALPLATDLVDQPVSLWVHADHDLVLGGFVDGARHVEQRRQTCVCD